MATFFSLSQYFFARQEEILHIMEREEWSQSRQQIRVSFILLMTQNLRSQPMTQAKVQKA
jgi:hypothetical protein